MHRAAAQEFTHHAEDRAVPAKPWTRIGHALVAAACVGNAADGMRLEARDPERENSG